VTDQNLLDGFPTHISLPVQWGDMDAYSHVNNTVFFRWFESARIVYLEQCGLTESRELEGVGAILHSTSCRFRLPVLFPDTVHVGTRVTDVGEDRFTMEYRVVSERHGAVAAEGQGIIVAYDYNANRKTTIPESVRHRIRHPG
jgi:acyl-CoA thioester hydrolase